MSDGKKNDSPDKKKNSAEKIVVSDDSDSDDANIDDELKQ